MRWSNELRTLPTCRGTWLCCRLMMTRPQRADARFQAWDLVVHAGESARLIRIFNVVWIG
jgi:hypothetical protein